MKAPFCKADGEIATSVLVQKLASAWLQHLGVSGIEQYSQPCLQMHFEVKAGADLLGAQSVDDRGFPNVWVAHKADTNIFLISAQA